MNEETSSKINKFKWILYTLGSFLIIILSYLLSKSNFEASKFVGLGYLGVFILSFLGSVTLFFPLPNVVTAVAAGLFLDPLNVAIIGGLGSSAGELSGYFVGYLGKAIFKNNEKIYLIIKKLFQKYPWGTIFLLALIPNPLFDVAGIIAGIMQYNIIKFYSATFLGKTVRYFILAYIGSQLKF
jgi:membrane protein YqaA with SNARE-associated domain